jgi:hypothetical protein
MGGVNITITRKEYEAFLGRSMERGGVARIFMPFRLTLVGCGDLRVGRHMQ